MKRIVYSGIFLLLCVSTAIAKEKSGEYDFYYNKQLYKIAADGQLEKYVGWTPVLSTSKEYEGAIKQSHIRPLEMLREVICIKLRVYDLPTGQFCQGGTTGIMKLNKKKHTWEEVAKSSVEYNTAQETIDRENNSQRFVQRGQSQSSQQKSSQPEIIIEGKIDGDAYTVIFTLPNHVTTLIQWKDYVAAESNRSKKKVKMNRIDLSHDQKRCQEILHQFLNPTKEMLQYPLNFSVTYNNELYDWDLQMPDTVGKLVMYPKGGYTFQQFPIEAETPVAEFFRKIRS